MLDFAMFLFDKRPNSNAPDVVHPAMAPDSPVHLEISSNRAPGAASSVRYHLDQRSDFLQLDGWWLYVSTPVGLACFPELGALLANAHALGLRAVLERLEGLRLVAFVAFVEDTECVYFGRSLDGFCSLFFAAQASRLIISDSRERVAESLGHATLSKRDKESWCLQARIEPEASFYEGVSRCFAGVRYCDDSAAPSRLSRHLMVENGLPLNQDDSIRLLDQGLLDLFAAYGERRIALRLSGGVDSRVLLVGLMEAVKRGILRKDQILCVSVLFPGLDCDESEEIRQITQIAGFEWAGIVADDDNVGWAYEQCLEFAAPPYPTSFIGALCLAESKNRGAQILLSGHGGDEIFDFDLTDLLAGSLLDRVRRARLIRILRNPAGPLDEMKAYASVCFGRRVMRTTKRMLQGFGLPPGEMRTHRLGMRLALAQSSSYELSASNVAAAGLLLDVPFLRGPFFPRFDPATWVFESDNEYKALANRYIRAHAPKIGAVGARKVSFDSMLEKHFQPNDEKCDELDGIGGRSYAAVRVYADWRPRNTNKGLRANANDK
jgi:asparagine synthetase B (glutamine-hydrolysing)